MSESTNEKKRRRLLTFGMRMLLVAVFLASIVLAWFSYYVVRAKREAYLVEATGILKPKFNYDYQFNNDTKSYDLKAGVPSGPAILKRYFGDHLFSKVEAVSISGLVNADAPELAEELEAFQKICQLSNLRHLDLFHCSEIKDLSDIGGLPELEKLSLTWCGPSDLSPLRNAKSLKQLNLDRCLAIKDLTPLLDLPNLNKLSLNQTACDDYSVLKGLPNLKILSIGQLKKEVGNWMWIGEMKSLEELYLADPNIETLPSLSALVGLKKLSIDCPNLQSLAPLADAKELTHLWLGKMKPYQPIEVIQGLPNLQVLQIRKDTFPIRERLEFEIERPNLEVIVF